MVNRSFIILSIILIVAAALRLYGIASNPPSLNWDEAAWGYNAYSLGVDLRDEFGVLLPYTYLESFGDFKPPLYAYVALIPVKIFGLNEFAVRFPSAFFGILTVLLTYFLVKEIFYTYKKNESQKLELLALISASVLALSPWHIMLSRAAFEANVASFFIVLGIFTFLRAIRVSPWLLVISALSFALSFYTFNTARIVAPLLVLPLACLFWRKLYAIKKQTIIAGVVGSALVLPLVPFLFSPQANLRFREVNIFTDSTVVEEANLKIANDDNALYSKILNNRRVGYTREFLRHYLDHFSPQFLFITGDVNPRFSTQDVGQLYLWDLVFLIIGVLFLFRRREGYWWLLPIWILVGIIPAATARETPHALRIETVLPTFQILVAYGVVELLQRVSKQRILVGTILASLLLVNVVYFLYTYAAHYAKEYSGEWQYGYKEAAEYVEEVKNEYDSVFVTSQLGRPYVYFLLYQKIDPQYFRDNSEVNRDPFGFVSVDRFDRIYFGKDLPHDSSGNNLFINVPEMVPMNAKIQKEIFLLNGKKVFVAYTIQEEER